MKTHTSASGTEWSFGKFKISVHKKMADETGWKRIAIVLTLRCYVRPIMVGSGNINIFIPLCTNFISFNFSLVELYLGAFFFVKIEIVRVSSLTDFSYKVIAKSGKSPGRVKEF